MRASHAAAAATTAAAWCGSVTTPRHVQAASEFNMTRAGGELRHDVKRDWAARGPYWKAEPPQRRRLKTMDENDIQLPLR